MKMQESRKKSFVVPRSEDSHCRYEWLIITVQQTQVTLLPGGFCLVAHVTPEVSTRWGQPPFTELAILHGSQVFI